MEKCNLLRNKEKNEKQKLTKSDKNKKQKAIRNNNMGHRRNETTSTVTFTATNQQPPFHLGKDGSADTGTVYSPSTTQNQTQSVKKLESDDESGTDYSQSDNEINDTETKNNKSTNVSKQKINNNDNDNDNENENDKKQGNEKENKNQKKDSIISTTKVEKRRSSKLKGDHKDNQYILDLVSHLNSNQCNHLMPGFVKFKI